MSEKNYRLLIVLIVISLSVQLHYRVIYH